MLQNEHKKEIEEFIKKYNKEITLISKIKKSIIKKLNPDTEKELINLISTMINTLIFGLNNSGKMKVLYNVINGVMEEEKLLDIITNENNSNLEKELISRMVS